MFLDCSNGIGGHAIKEFKKLIPESPVNINVFNDSEYPDYLNDGCGAEYVHKD